MSFERTKPGLNGRDAGEPFPFGPPSSANPADEIPPWTAVATPIASLGVLYLLARLASNALGVIAVDIEADFHLLATETAALAGGMSLAYGLAQVPGSMAIGRFGAHAVVPAAGLALSVATIGSAVAPDYWTLLASRLMIGVCLAPLFPASLSIAAALAGKSRFDGLSGLLTWLGRLGAVGATAPLALVIVAIGWRNSFAWLAAACGVASLVALPAVAARAKFLEASKGAKSLVETLSLLKIPGFAAIVAFQGAASAALNGLLGFWGTGWLKNVYGMPLPDRSLDLFVMATSWAVSALAWGAAPRWFGRSSAPLLLGAAVAAATLAAPALLLLDRRWLMVWSVILGLTTGYYPALLTRLKALLAPAAVVPGIALLSAGSMVCVFIGQMASGLILDLFPGGPGEHPPEAYRTLFAVFAITMAAAIAAFWMSTRKQT